MGSNWKTSLGGAVAILSGFVALGQLLMGELSAEAAWPLILTAWAAGTALLNAKDASTDGEAKA